MSVDPGSYRDLAGQVHVIGDKIYRTVTPYGRLDYEAVRDSGVLNKFVERGWVISATESENPPLLGFDTTDHIILEHPRVPVVSYPWEWTFSALKAAALLHLDLHMELLQDGFTLVDASAFNIQFFYNTPIFVDYLSFRPYKEKEPWYAHQQFCEQFLNPLILQSHLGVPFQPWFRGRLEGIPTEHIATLLKSRHAFSFIMLTHVVLPGVLKKRFAKKALDVESSANARPLSRTRFYAILGQLRRYIARLQARNIENTQWCSYASKTTYSERGRTEKHHFVQAFCERHRPSLVVDVGCNIGEYSDTALSSGTRAAVGLESDLGALETAFLNTQRKDLSMVALYQDLADPSPDLGWAWSERPALIWRLTDADAVLALAVVHHLAIGRNIPLTDVVNSIMSIADKGVIEFVPKRDSTVQKMLVDREDVFPEYNWDVFCQTIQDNGTVTSQETISDSGRTLVEFTCKKNVD